MNSSLNKNFYNQKIDFLLKAESYTHRAVHIKPFAIGDMASNLLMLNNFLPFNRKNMIVEIQSTKSKLRTKEQNNKTTIQFII